MIKYLILIFRVYFDGRLFVCEKYIKCGYICKAYWHYINLQFTFILNDILIELCIDRSHMLPKQTCVIAKQ